MSSAFHSAFRLALFGFAASCASQQPMITKLVDGQVITVRSISPRAYEHNARALVYEEEERWEEAAAEYRLALEYDPRSPEMFARLAEVQLELDRPEEAQSAIDRSLAIEPTVDGVVAAAHLHLHRGDPRAAARVLGDALLKFDFAHEPEALLRLTLERAEAQVMALDLQGAQQTLETLLSTRPTAEMALYRQAAITWALGELKPARRYLERLIDLEPDHLEARLLLARLLTMTNQVSEARSAYAAALERSEGDLAVASLYATFLAAEGLRKEAQTLADDLQVNESDPATVASRMQLEHAAGRLPRALAIADAVLASSPDKKVEGEVLLAKGQELEAARQLEPAIVAFMAIREGASSFVPGRLRAASLLRELDRQTEANAVLEKLSAGPLEKDMQLEVTVAKALLAGSRGKLPEARALLETKPEGLASRQRLAMGAASLEDKYGDWKRALTLAEQVLVRDPSHVEALNFWAFVAADHQHALPTALRRAQAALALNPGSAAIMDTMGWIYYQQKLWDQATVFLEAAARIAPDEPEILSHVASLYVQRRQLDLARARATRALELQPEPKLRAQLEALLKTISPPPSPTNRRSTP